MGGTITNTVFGNEGDDHVVWSGGEIIGLDMGADTDLAHFIGLTPINLKVGLPVNGRIVTGTLTIDLTVHRVRRRRRPASCRSLLANWCTSTMPARSILPRPYAARSGHPATPDASRLGRFSLRSPDHLEWRRLRLDQHSGDECGRARRSDDRQRHPGGGRDQRHHYTRRICARRVVAAGIFEYLLFRGGVTPAPATDNDWFLRSVSPLRRHRRRHRRRRRRRHHRRRRHRHRRRRRRRHHRRRRRRHHRRRRRRHRRRQPPTPIIRPEIPGYLIVPGMARQMGIATLGTFHQRRGDQSLLTGNGTTTAAFAMAGPQGDQTLSGRSGPPPAAWGRVFGGSREQQWSPDDQRT